MRGWQALLAHRAVDDVRPQAGRASPTLQAVGSGRSDFRRIENIRAWALIFLGLHPKVQEQSGNISIIMFGRCHIIRAILL